MHLPFFNMLTTTITAYCLITSAMSQKFPMPNMTFAFTASIYDYAVGPPVPFPGYNQTFLVALNSTLSGPLLNATLVSLSGVEQDFDSSTGSNVTYFTSQAQGLYMTDDGELFNWEQIGYTSNTTDAFWANLGGIGGRYAYLRQYLIMCVAPVHTSYDFNSTTETATASATAMPSAFPTGLAGLNGTAILNDTVAAHEAYCDCYIVGGV